MESELVRASTSWVVARSIAAVVEMLTGAEGTRPQTLIIDLDALTAGELFHLHRIRERGWGGRLIALGKIPMSLRASLGIDRSIAPPYVEDVLCEDLVQHAQESQATTMPLPLMLY
jgi:hypothetical protein